jgi:hypothetical protein
MKDLNPKYTIEDINNFISTQEKESNRIEFKSGDELAKLYNKDIPAKVKDTIKDNIAIDVSSFANSSGGIIVYGIETNFDRAEKVVSFNGEKITPETIEKIIDIRVERRIDYKIYPIQQDNDVARSIYVIEIPPSTRAPHMTSEKYYRRYNFKSVPMSEDEVRGLYARREKTKLAIVTPVVKIIDGQRVNHYEPQIYSANVSIYMMAKNIGNTIENIYNFECTIPSACSPKLDPEVIWDYNKTQAYRTHHSRSENGFEIFDFPNNAPLFQGQTSKAYAIFARIDRNSFRFKFPITIKLYYSAGVEEYLFDLMKIVRQEGYLAERFK